MFSVITPLGFPGGSDGKESACSMGDRVRSLSWEDSLEKGRATTFIFFLFLICFYFIFNFYFILLDNTVLVLPYINMNQPQDASGWCMGMIQRDDMG